MHVGIDGRELQDHMTGIGRSLSEALLHFVSLRPQWKWTLFHTNDGTVAPYTDYQTIRLSNGSVLVQDQWELPNLAKKTGISHFVLEYFRGTLNHQERFNILRAFVICLFWNWRVWETRSCSLRFFESSSRHVQSSMFR